MECGISGPMRGGAFLGLLLLSAAPAAAQKESLGTFWSWGAFAENGRCYAISEPQRSPRARHR